MSTQVDISMVPERIKQTQKTYKHTIHQYTSNTSIASLLRHNIAAANIENQNHSEKQSTSTSTKQKSKMRKNEMVNDVCNMQLQRDVRSVQCKVQMKQRLFSQIASSSHVSHCTTFHAKINHQVAEKS